MCGKFTQMLAWAKLVELADILETPTGPAESVTPMRDATVIRRGPDGRREAVRMRWGFVPAGARDPLGPRHIHARSEDIETKRTFRNAFFDRRGLVVVSTFNEGEDVSATRRVQHVITPRDGKPIAIAVIWEPWSEPHAGELLTFAMVTVPANTLIGAITDRMPAIVQPRDWATWLGENNASFDEVKAVLKPFEGDWDMRPQTSSRKAKPASQPSLF